MSISKTDRIPIKNLLIVNALGILDFNSKKEFINKVEKIKVSIVEKFITQLQKHFPSIPVEKWDETYTSKMAMQTLVASGVKKKQRRDKKLLDQISATIILQEYLQNL